MVKCKSCETEINLETVIACDRCKVSGCSECIKTECCDCSIQMCRACSDIDDIMCDCYGKCNTCGTDVSRGSGWPCSECRIWNCRDCRRCDNPCKECGPESESESEDEPDLEEDEENDLKISSN